MGTTPSKKKSPKQLAFAPQMQEQEKSCCGGSYGYGGGKPLHRWRPLPTQCVRVVEYEDVDPDARPVVDADAEAAAVIITVHTGGSYDKMFRQVPQAGAPGQRIAVYEAGYGALADIVRLVTDDAADAAAGPNDATPRTAPAGALGQLAADVAVVEAGAVLLNFECCGHCNDQGFGADTATALRTIEAFLARGSTVMCSDFSLKALIGTWGPERTATLGPNPFVSLGECTTGFDLRFDPAVLAACSSAQLQKVGELCNEGKAHSHAMSGTIVYGVDAKVAESTDKYELQVLTVATNLDGRAGAAKAMVKGQWSKGEVAAKTEVAAEGEVAAKGTPNDVAKATLSSAGGHQGAAGHVLITYPSGGELLTSMGHWIELVKLDVSVARLLEVAKKSYGAEYAGKMQADLMSCASDGFAQEEMLQKFSAKLVQQTVPHKYSSKSKSKSSGFW